MLLFRNQYYFQKLGVGPQAELKIICVAPRFFYLLYHPVIYFMRLNTSAWNWRAPPSKRYFCKKKKILTWGMISFLLKIKNFWNSAIIFGSSSVFVSLLQPPVGNRPLKSWSAMIRRKKMRFQSGDHTEIWQIYSHWYKMTYAFHIYEPFIHKFVKLWFWSISFWYMVRNAVFHYSIQQQSKCNAWIQHIRGAFISHTNF